MTHRTRLNKAFGKYGQLRPGSLRYKLVQYLGYLLWGRKIGYLSWWQHSARCASVLFFHKGKLLLGKRSEKMADRPNTYGIIGGFVDGMETFAEGLSREIKEETTLEIPSENFPWKSVFNITDGTVSLAEQGSFLLTQAIFIYRLSAAEVSALKTTSEVTEFLWVSADMLDDLQARGLVAFQRDRETIERAFVQAEKVQPEKSTQDVGAAKVNT